MTFQEILDRYGVTHSLNPARRNWVSFDCPFCGPRPTPYMGWRIGTRVCYCWKCRTHSVFDVVREISGASNREIVKMLEDLADDAWATAERDVRGKLTLPSPIEETMPKRHREYLESERELDLDFCIDTIQLKATAAWAQLKTPEGKKMQLNWRIIIPYFHKGKMVSWNSRALKKSDPMRYYGAPASCEVLNRKELLFMEHLAHHAVCVVEGEFDAIKVGPGCVATGGIAYKTAQVARIAKYPERGIWFDNEEGAQQRARELAADLAGFPGKTHLIRGDSKDPGSASGREIRHVRNFLSL